MKPKTFVAGLFVAISTFTLGVCSCEGLGFVSSFSTGESSVRQATSFSERASVGEPTDGLSTEQKSRSIPEGRAGIYHLDQSFNGEFYTFDSIELQTTEFGYDATGTWCERSVKPEAVMEGNDVLFDSILVKDNEIAFSTETVHGESYIFAGVFRDNPHCGIDVTTAGIDGRLIKVKNGEIVAVMAANFHSVCGC